MVDNIDYPVPEGETERLNKLMGYDILDTAPEKPFDKITQLASTMFDTPVSLVSFVDEKRQWLKSKVGIYMKEIPREISFCAHTICVDEVMVIPDTFEDKRFKQNPLVVNYPEMRFYAGTPLRTSDGFNIGTLSIIDNHPKEFSQNEEMMLQKLGSLVMQEMSLREDAACDYLTKAMNRRTFINLLNKEIKRANRHGAEFCLAILDIDNFKKVNDEHGHLAGDEVLKAMSKLCEHNIRLSDIWCRLGGEEFACMLIGTDAENANKVVNKLRKMVAETKVKTDKGDIGITVSAGICEYKDMEVSELIENADKALYAAKAAGRNQVCISE